jgi:hypothetical protein
MPWHKVVIPNVGGALAFGHDLVRAFMPQYKAAGRPQTLQSIGIRKTPSQSTP